MWSTWSILIDGWLRNRILLSRGLDPDLSKQTGRWKKYVLSSGVKTTDMFKDKLFFESWYVTYKLKAVPFVFILTECGLVKPQYASDIKTNFYLFTMNKSNAVGWYKQEWQLLSNKYTWETERIL